MFALLDYVKVLSRHNSVIDGIFGIRTSLFFPGYEMLIGFIVRKQFFVWFLKVEIIRPKKLMKCSNIVSAFTNNRWLAYGRILLPAVIKPKCWNYSYRRSIFSAICNTYSDKDICTIIFRIGDLRIKIGIIVKNSRIK